MLITSILVKPINSTIKNRINTALKNIWRLDNISYISLIKTFFFFIFSFFSVSFLFLNSSSSISCPNSSLSSVITIVSSCFWFNIFFNSFLACFWALFFLYVFDASLMFATIFLIATAIAANSATKKALILFLKSFLGSVFISGIR